MAGERPGRLVGRLRLGRLAEPAFLAALAAPAAAGALTLLVVVPTLAPSVASWDTAEFQTVGPVLGTAHPTGYPSYVILGWLASILLQPFGEPAYRMNLLQAMLAAVAVAGAAGIVQVLTGRRLIALATGLLLACSQLFWRLSTHADPHMFHVALTALLFVVLLIWDQRRHSDDPAKVAHADRWLVAAAGIFGVAVANHSLALLLPPAIGLFILVADWRIIRRGRTILACCAVLIGTMAILFAELPIRAAMNAPLVYGHPDTWSGFRYVVMAEQFRGSLSDPLGDLPTKAGHVMDLMTGWLGPLSTVAALGVLTSLIKRPRYLVLSGLAAVATCVFSASYANADIQRYYLVPLLVAYTWIGLAFADLLAVAANVMTFVRWVLEASEKPAETDEAEEAGGPSLTPLEPVSDSAPRLGREESGLIGRVVLLGEVAIAAALVLSSVNVVPDRQRVAGTAPGAVSEAKNTYDSTWMHAVLAPADQGGLPENSVIMGWWSVSTTLWYGQKALGLRRDIYIIDDRTRLDANLGEVQDVFNRFLGNRPVFTIRLDGGADGMIALSQQFEMRTYTLGSGFKITQVIGRKGSQ